MKFSPRIKEICLLGVAQGLRVGQAIIVTVLFARTMSKEDFGNVGYAMILSQLFLPIAELGSNNILVREFSRLAHTDNLTDKRSWLSTAVHTRTLVALAIAPLAALLSALLGNSTATSTLVFLFSLGYLFRVFEPFELWSYSHADFASPAIARGIGFVAMIVACATAVSMNASPHVIVAIYSLSFTVYSASIFLLARWRTQAPSVMLHVDAQRSTLLVRESYPLIIAGIANTLYMRIDTLFLKPISGPTAVATYMAAARLSQGLYMIPGAVSDATFPRIVKKTALLPHESINHEWQIFFNRQLQLAVTIAALAAVSAPILIPTIFGHNFIDSVGVFQLHCISLIPVSLNVVAWKYLVAQNMQKYCTLSTIVGLTVNLTLNAALIPHFSFWGAAWATLISSIFAGPITFLSLTTTKEVFHLYARAFLNILTPLQSKSK